MPTVPVNLDTVDKKLREAVFFLQKMIAQEAGTFGEGEAFDYYLSAFLSAATSARKAVRDTAWRKTWGAGLEEPQRQLIHYLGKDRDIEVHRDGSRRSVTLEDIPIGNAYSDASGTIQSGAAPRTLIDVEPPVIYKPAYFFTIDGAERKATDACGEYFGLLCSMVAKFRADHP